ncbi:hypothetical protein D9V32_00615 [Mycetocola tolaasinivorans]|uniref:Uncharacterized protein n=1 Tax=Mycetocola tolaasinivorans TaxID=76635 RepID=A0A3L7AD06_9MICO|nr:hypothetical protein D9V32_00615 [Mycetocola tolaasinivorans]
MAWFNLVSAIAGGIGLIFGDGIGMPSAWLEGSVFSSYLWPGIILGVIVGGSQALALLASYGHRKWALDFQIAAGLIMMIWIFVEIAIILVWSPLQGIYFATGLVQTVLAVLLLGAGPRPFMTGISPAATRTHSGIPDESTR